MSLHTLTIPLSKGFSATVSEADFGYLSRFKWCALIRSGKPYATRFVDASAVTMHRVIANPPAGMCVDHINGDTLDNRRENLRICTRAENLRNRRSVRGTSRFKGVSRTKEGRWRVGIGVNGKYTYVSTHLTEAEAAAAYDAEALKQYGEFARLNFPPVANV